MAKTRSPNFPFIALDKAVDRARQVWDKQGRHGGAPETIVGHWGYAAKSSGGRQTIAALRHFGLLEGRGASLVLTQLAQSILFTEEETPQWLALIRDAALNPAIHKEIWEKYEGDLPSSDQVLRYYLVVERGFGEGGAAELIEELRSTLRFARLGPNGDSMSPKIEDKREDDEQMSATLEAETPQDTPVGPSRRAVQLPYSGTAWAVLQAAFPLSDEEWDQMLAVLTAMKPALTERADD